MTHSDHETRASAESSVAATPLVQRASIRRNIAQMTSSQVVSWTLATVSSVIVPRFLGPANLGLLSQAGSLWAISAVFAALGTSMHLQLAISRNQRHGLALIAPVLTLRTIAFAIAAAILAGYVLLTGAEATLVWLMVFLGVTTLVGLWAEVFNTSFVGLETMSTVAVVSVVIKSVILGATVGVLLVGLGLFGVVAVGLLATILGLVLIVWRFRRVINVDWSLWRTGIIALTKTSSPYMMVGLAIATYRQIDIIVISQVAGRRDLGWYSAADTLFGSLLFPTTVIIATVFPTLGRLYVHDQPALRQLVRKTFSLLVVVTVPIGLGAAVVGPNFARFLFGSEFAETGTLLAIFGPLTVLTFGTTFLGAIAIASDRQRFVALLLFGAAALTIPLDLILVPWATERFDNGAIGGALAFVVTETLQFAIGLWVIAPYIVTRRWAWQTFRVFLAGSVMMAVAWPLREQFVLVPAAAGAIAYAIATVALRTLNDDQTAMLRSAADRLRRRSRS